MSKTETPQLVSPSPKPLAHYTWAVIILMLFAVILIMTIIQMRPTVDPIIIIGAVMTAMTPTTAAVLALMKAQETHLSVNSRLDEFMNQHAKAARSEGLMEGITQEQDRIKEKQRHEVLMGAAEKKLTEPVETVVKNPPNDPVHNQPVQPSL